MNKSLLHEENSNTPALLPSKVPMPEPVATVCVGHLEHGPFLFKETAYGADTLKSIAQQLFVRYQLTAYAEARVLETVKPLVEALRESRSELLFLESLKVKSIEISSVIRRANTELAPWEDLK